jgi:hypothetical protein
VKLHISYPPFTFHPRNRRPLGAGLCPTLTYHESPTITPHTTHQSHATHTQSHAIYPYSHDTHSTHYSANHWQDSNRTYTACYRILSRFTLRFLPWDHTIGSYKEDPTMGSYLGSSLGTRYGTQLRHFLRYIIFLENPRSYVPTHPCFLDTKKTITEGWSTLLYPATSHIHLYL